MEDKPKDDPLTDTPTDTLTDNEEVLSLNKFDLMDAELRAGEIDSSKAFNTLLELNENTDNQNEQGKQAPGIPEAFGTTKEDMMSLDMDNMAFDDHDLSSPYTEEPRITPKLDHPEESSQPEAQQPQEKSHGKTILIFVIIAILIVAIVAWFNLGVSEKDTVHLGMQDETQQHVLGDDIQLQRMEKQLSSLRDRLSLMEKRILLKDQRIAELNHLLAEQSRQQKKRLTKKPIVKETTVKETTVKPTVIKKTTPQVQEFTTTLSNKPSAGWVLVVASVHSRAAADKARAVFKAKDINTEVHPITVKGKPWYRIRISGFASKQEAKSKKVYLAKHHGIDDAWIHKPK